MESKEQSSLTHKSVSLFSAECRELPTSATCTVIPRTLQATSRAWNIQPVGRPALHPNQVALRGHLHDLFQRLLHFHLTSSHEGRPSSPLALWCSSPGFLPLSFLFLLTLWLAPLLTSKCWLPPPLSQAHACESFEILSFPFYFPHLPQTLNSVMLAEPMYSPLPCRKVVLSLCPHLCPKERLWILIFCTGNLRVYNASPANADASLLWLLEMFYEIFFPQPPLPLDSLLSLLGMKVRESCSFCNSIFRGSSIIPHKWYTNIYTGKILIHVE